MCRLHLYFKILGEILFGHVGSSSFTKGRLNLNFKILSEILGSHTWGVNHLHHVQAIYELQNVRLEIGQS